MMSLMFIVGFFTLLLLPLTYMIILASLRPDHHQGHHGHMSSSVAASGRISAVAGVKYAAGPQKEECRVCLSEVEEGEEIGELRCRHVFHKDCLDAWVGTGHATCPLCRGRVFAPALLEGHGDVGSEVVKFRFCSSMSRSTRAGRDQGTWWLR